MILLQAPGAAIDLRPILSTGAWRVQHVDKLSALAIELPADPCPAAVAVIDDVARFAPGELSSMLANSQCEWLAIATREVTNDKRFAMLFAQYFFDFHTLPIDARQLLFSLGHAFGKAMMRERLSSEAMSVRGRFGMVGTSASMQAMYRVLEKVARADAPLLISGESGTGKELAALAIHRESARRDGRFVAVNCGAIPTTLMQAQLFGYEKGAFTGAHQRSIGSFESANGGTLFLDEIADLPLESQASLLRFLQESTIVRIGAHGPIRIDARVLAATHVDLEAAVRAGRFREDLFYRLNVLHLALPPLRARGDDLTLLVEHVFERYRSDKAPAVRGVSGEALEAMRAHGWPGNVRELFNRLHKAMIMCER
ncbi:MAG: sigma-54-dependent Fis family transcriptional regulator, partial [Burkholderiaceae bacterium]|nr:sigma-54-dependent Fis family transcriptional regulator [Burkholderiaceae bacterium]